MKEPKDKRTKKWKEWKKNQVEDINYENVIDLSIKEDEPLEPSKKGLGDLVEDILHSPILEPLTNVIKKLIWKDEEDCGCDERKKKLNELFKKKNIVPGCITKKQYDIFESIKINGEIIKKTDIIKIFRLHSELFNHKYIKLCSCNPKRIKGWYNELDIIYKTYTKED